MGQEIDRGGGVGVRDLEHLEAIVGCASGIARIRLAQRLLISSDANATLISSQPCWARATPCAASSPIRPGNAIFGNPNSGISKPFVPFIPACSSLSLT